MPTKSYLFIFRSKTIFYVRVPYCYQSVNLILMKWKPVSQHIIYNRVRVNILVISVITSNFKTETEGMVSF